MAWHLRVKSYESCSCKMICPCTMGPAEPDRGWCSGSFAFEVQDGSSDGVDLSGVRVALGAELPGDFLGGIDRARLYVDERASAEQRRELEAIFAGERGGIWADMAGAITEWLPSQTAAIDIDESADGCVVRIGQVGRLDLTAVRTQDGRQAALENAPVAVGLGQDRIDLAMGTGSRWDDPDLRPWESGGYGGSSVIEWSA